MKIRRLNALRGLAAFIVLVSHYSNASGLWNGMLGWGGGQFGVMIFFLLSAFLMAYLYLETPPSFSAVKKYAIARIARVAPLFLLVVVVSYAVKCGNVVFFRDVVYNIPDIRSLLSNLILMQGESVLWTIPPEIHFYIFFLFIWVARPRFLNWIWVYWGILGLILAAYVIKMACILLAPPHGTPLFIQTTFFGLPATLYIATVLHYFITGLFFGHLFNCWHPPDRLRRHWFAFALFGLPFLYPQVITRIAGIHYGWELVWWNLAIFVCVSFIFFVAVFLVPPKNPFLENKIADKLGEISYSIYLLHFPVLSALKKTKLATADIRGLLLFLVLSVTIASLSFSFFERPMRLKIRSYFLSDGGCIPNISPDGAERNP